MLGALGDLEVSVEHIGSTAVPGLAAKPVIDIDVVQSPTEIPAAIERLATLGYAHQSDKGVPGRGPSAGRPKRIAITSTWWLRTAPPTGDICCSVTTSASIPTRPIPTGSLRSSSRWRTAATGLPTPRPRPGLPTGSFGRRRWISLRKGDSVGSVDGGRGQRAQGGARFTFDWRVLERLIGAGAELADQSFDRSSGA